MTRYIVELTPCLWVTPNDGTTENMVAAQTFSAKVYAERAMREACEGGFYPCARVVKVRVVIEEVTE